MNLLLHDPETHEVILCDGMHRRPLSPDEAQRLKEDIDGGPMPWKLHVASVILGLGVLALLGNGLWGQG